MIVRNEADRIERCLASVAGRISCWAICDTGSDDGTPDLIQSFFAERGIPGEIFHVQFRNFSQARNAALNFARQSTLDFDYLFLLDADMELVTEKPLPDLTEPAYRIIQRGGELTYWNTRFLRRDAMAEYIGVTHEYLSVEGNLGQIEEWWFKDYMDGSNRKDKFDRDIQLLLNAIQKNPKDARAWYYFAQSTRDAGKPKQAAISYLHRAAMGGWDEEAWSARLNAARCLRDSDDIDGFVREALAAYAQRPTRVEPLFDLARFYRERGENALTLLFADAGKRIQVSNDLLFVEHDSYNWGFDQEISIAANYLSNRIVDGRDACESLALRRDVPAEVRDLARINLYWYSQPLSEIAPSFMASRVDFSPPEGWNSLNPSILLLNDKMLLMQRTVNYGENYVTPNNEPIKTRNFLRYSDDVICEVALPTLPNPPLYSEVRGFEDLRIFSWQKQLWAIATARELNVDGYAEQVLCRIEENCIVEWRRIVPQGLPRWHEKNWMPAVDANGDCLQFIYLCDPTRILDENGNTLVLKIPNIAADNFRGGSQAIEYEGGWLAVIHESYWRPVRHYRHRFVWFDREWGLTRLSSSFHLRGKNIEYVAGLARHRDNLLLSFGANDCESWLGYVNAAEIDRILHPVREIRKPL